MLTKSDLSSIKQVVRDEIQKEFKPVKTDIAAVKTDVAVLKTDVSVLKTDVAFTKDAVINLLDESQDIHETLVKEKLPQRVHRLEHIVHATA